MTASPTIEALEAEETEEERNIDELEEALEASGETGEEDVEADETGTPAPEEVAEEEQEGDPVEEPEEGAEEAPEEAEVETPAPEEEELQKQNRELRQLLRDQRKDMALMQAKLGRLETGVTATLEDEEREPPELTNIEKLQGYIGQLGQERGPMYEALVEAMEMKPEYADMREVCSRENFDTVFEQVASVIAERENLDPVEVALGIEAEVWQMPNPYKYMYKIIKDNLPQYAEEEPKKETSKKKPVPKEAPKAPASIAAVGGSDADTKSGWTSKRIDELPEDELDKVPHGVYEKYLRGELD